MEMKEYCISEKDKLAPITRITDDVMNYPPGDGDEVGYYAATINCIGLIAAFGEDQDAEWTGQVKP